MHYLIINKGRVFCNVTDAQDGRLPLVQMGLEIPMIVGCCEAGKEQRAGHKKMQTVGE